MTLAIERPNPHARSVVPILSGLVAGLAFVYRFTSFSNFENDHFVHLARGRQLLLGDLPVRDFVDPGMPFFYAAYGGGPGRAR